MSKRARTSKTYRKVESNIREVTYVYDDGTRQVAGFEVRVGQTRAGGGLLPNITQARRVRSEALSAVGQGAYIAPSAGRITVKEMADRWLGSAKATKWKPRTAAGYVNLVNNRLKPLHDVAVKDVTAHKVDAFIADLMRQGLQPSTVRHVYHVLNQAMRLAVRDRHIVANPCAEVGRPGLVREEPSIPQRPDVEALLAALRSDGRPRAGEWALYAELAAYAGLRAGEIGGLRVRHLDPLRKTIRVEETVYLINGTPSVGTPKSKAGKRTVPLPPDLCLRLAAHVAGRSPADYVFGDGSAPFRHDNFYRRVFKPVARSIGLPSLTFHQLRHFYASLLLTNPHLNPVDIAKVLGHSDTNLLLNTYGHSFDNATAGVGEWLDGLRSGVAQSPTVVSLTKAAR